MVRANVTRKSLSYDGPSHALYIYTKSVRLRPHPYLPIHTFLVRIKQVATRSACLVNRGLVKFALERFYGAAEDLRGTDSRGEMPSSTGAGSSGGGNDGEHSEGRTTGVKNERGGGRGFGGGEGMCIGVGDRVRSGGRGEGALDTLDCSLARVLAEARITTKESWAVSLSGGSRNAG